MVIVLMGVSGVGKTTVGLALASELGWTFRDADELHSPENIAHMREGEPLDDAQRAPWLAALAALIEEHVRSERPLVLACSALSRAHRAVLLGDDAITAEVRLVHLRAEREVLARRLAEREDHFFAPALLDSQFAALEEPERDAQAPVLTLDATLPVDQLVAAIRRAFAV